MRQLVGGQLSPYFILGSGNVQDERECQLSVVRQVQQSAICLQNEQTATVRPQKTKRLFRLIGEIQVRIPGQLSDALFETGKFEPRCKQFLDNARNYKISIRI